MYMRVSLRKLTYSTFYTQIVLHDTHVFPKFATIYIATHGQYVSIVTETHVYHLNTRLLFLKPAYFSCRHQQQKNYLILGSLGGYATDSFSCNYFIFNPISR